MKLEPQLDRNNNTTLKWSSGASALPTAATVLCNFEAVDNEGFSLNKDQNVRILQISDGRCQVQPAHSTQTAWVPAYILEPQFDGEQQHFIRARHEWLRLTARSPLSGATKPCADLFQPLVYKPVVRNAASPVRSGYRTKLRHEYRPCFTQALTASFNVAVGGQATLNCEVDALPPARIMWAGPALVHAPQRCSFHSDGAKCTLIVVNSQLADSGPYSCTASNPLGHDVMTVMLNVITHPSAPGKPLVVEQTGRAVKLEWTAPAYTGNSSVLWYTILYRTEDMEDHEVAVESCAGTSLLIDDLNIGHTYWFRVRAYNEAFSSPLSSPSKPVVIAAQEHSPTELSERISLTWNGDFYTYFWVTAEVARGRFGVVKQAVNKQTGTQFAVKLYSKVDTTQDLVEEEFSILQQLNHPSIVQATHLYDSVHDYLMLMYWVAGLPLFDYALQMSRFTESLVQRLIKQLVGTLVFLHDRSVVHLDIKPENLIVQMSEEEPRLVLIDFGDAKILRKDESYVQVVQGSVEFLAPEQVLGQPVTLATDVWSAGVVTYALLSGISPFLDDTIEETRTNIVSGDFSFPFHYFGPVSNTAEDFLRSVLVVEPGARPSALNASSDPWFEKDLSRNIDLPREALSNFVERRKLVATKRDSILTIGM